MRGLSPGFFSSDALIGASALRITRQTRQSFFLALMLFCISIWAGFQWSHARPTDIAHDLVSWRQADTQSIALNFLHEDARLLWPRINWRGAGPGFVESELQLYPYLAMQLMRLGGEGVWAGQLISLFSMVLAMGICLWQLAQRFSLWAVVAASIGLFSSRNTLFLSTSIQPDALAFLAYVAGFWTFLAWLEDSHARVRYLVAATLFTSLAALIKPPALHLGIIEFLLVMLLKPIRLHQSRIWFAWLVILLVVGAFLYHAAQLHFIYGNTFGVLSGGDSKFPKLHHLLDSSIWLGLFKAIASWGTGYVGLAALLFLTLRWQWDRLMLAMFAGMGIYLLVAFRYSAGNNGHYHVYELLLASYAVAKATDLGLKDWRRITKRPSLDVIYWLLTTIFFALLAGYGAQRFMIQNQEREQNNREQPAIISLAKQFRDYLVQSSASSPAAWPVSKSLVVTRSAFTRYDPFWQTIDNFEDPRFFYAARVFGWILPADTVKSEQLQALQKLGAEYYAEPNGIPDDPELDAWLQTQAELVINGSAGKVWRL